MSARRPLALLLVAAGGLMGTGCGSEAGSNPDSASFSNADQQAVETAITDFSDRVGKHDYDGICSQALSASLKAQLSKGASCSDRIERSMRDVDATKLAVLTIRVQGTAAEATVQPKGTGSVEAKARYVLAKEGTRWKIAGIA